METNENKTEIVEETSTKKHPIENEKTKTVAGIFAILLGSLGIHKFYLGKTGLGIIYILLCWTGIPGIVGIIEGIIYLTMTDDAFNQKYNTPPTTATK